MRIYRTLNGTVDIQVSCAVSPRHTRPVTLPAGDTVSECGGSRSLGSVPDPMKICNRGQSPLKCHILSFKTVVG